jgi:hypothetical protein
MVEMEDFWRVFKGGETLPEHLGSTEIDAWSIEHVAWATLEPQGNTRSVAGRLNFWQIVIGGYSAEPHSTKPRQFCKIEFFKAAMHFKIFRGSIGVLGT